MKKIKLKNFNLSLMFFIITLLYSISCFTGKMEILFHKPAAQFDYYICDSNVCPEEKFTSVGKTVILDIPYLDTKASDIKWKVTNAPGGGGAIWYPPKKNAKIQSFTPKTNGVYFIEVSYSVSGVICSCEFIVDVGLSNCNTNICPGSTTLPLGDSTKLDIKGIDPGATQIYWRTITSPGGATWDPPEKNSITEKFTPDKVGTYKLQVSYVLDGYTCSCDFIVDVVPSCNQSICPPSSSVFAGDTTKLDIKGIDSAATQISWQLQNPYGGEKWDPPGQNAITELFTPYIIGVYNMQVSYNLYGEVCICDFDLDVKLKPSQFRIELTWNGKGDVDLHLNSPSMKDPMKEEWQTNQDCFYLNETTKWGASLDVDNTVKNGPENIVLNSDKAPAGKYHIGVANFREAEGRVATVKIYCGSNTPTVYKSRTLQVNDFWVVASIDPDKCNIKDINKYRDYIWGPETRIK